ncbi:uncharacterized protein PV07_03899 [Cladophialophora immunda]|uniref:N-acetyltransferase domain-containing protein n=1 Tax=Cladophialophora immunda TaxID=569365 RepID=A0A0D2CQS2_9EURO|nr:uncharacterized protein PV07_03899 [Cladophialophora immunda]KIW32345.1 hypothetical protein PV07_03899 [Cladophialophora immunda]OQV07881.1 Acetyltransferase GNAT domain-containing protein [Cladophialophora immunda]
MKKTTRPEFPVPPSPMTTARLLLRPIQQSDLEDFHALRSEIEVMKWTSTGKVDVDKEATQVWMNRFLPPNDATTFNFAIEELASPGKPIGVLGCHIAEPPECGYMLRTDSWGKGYATEALRRWLQAWWELPRKDVTVEEAEGETGTDDCVVMVPEVLRADIDGNNIASAKILAKCGFRRVAEELIQENGTAVNLITFELTRPR